MSEDKKSKAPEFGKALEKARKAAELDVETLSRMSKVQSRFIHALEREDWGFVPSGVIGRGFVRILAREIGGNVDELLELYAKARPDSDEMPEAHVPQMDQSFVKPNYLKPVLLCLSLVALIAAIIWIWQPWNTVQTKPEAVAFKVGFTASEKVNLVISVDGGAFEPRSVGAEAPLEIEALDSIAVEGLDPAKVKVSVDGKLTDYSLPGSGPVTFSKAGVGTSSK